MMPEASPTAFVRMRDGFGGSRAPRQSSSTETRIMQPIARRTGLDLKPVNNARPRGMPSTRPGLNPPTARQSQCRQACRIPTAPTMTCKATTKGTTLAGGNARLSSGTATRPKPKPVKPRANAAASTPNMAMRRVSTIVGREFCIQPAGMSRMAGCGMLWAQSGGGVVVCLAMRMD